MVLTAAYPQAFTHLKQSWIPIQYHILGHAWKFEDIVNQFLDIWTLCFYSTVDVPKIDRVQDDHQNQWQKHFGGRLSLHEKAQGSAVHSRCSFIIGCDQIDLHLTCRLPMDEEVMHPASKTGEIRFVEAVWGPDPTCKVQWRWNEAASLLLVGEIHVASKWKTLCYVNLGSRVSPLVDNALSLPLRVWTSDVVRQIYPGAHSALLMVPMLRQTRRRSHINLNIPRAACVPQRWSKRSRGMALSASEQCRICTQRDGDTRSSKQLCPHNRWVICGKNKEVAKRTTSLRVSDTAQQQSSITSLKQRHASVALGTLTNSPDTSSTAAIKTGNEIPPSSDRIRAMLQRRAGVSGSTQLSRLIIPSRLKRVSHHVIQLKQDNIAACGAYQRQW